MRLPCGVSPLGSVHRTWLGGVELAVTAVLLGLLAGPPGLAVGAGLLVCWLLLPVAYTVALGQFALLALFPASTPVALLAEAGLVGALAASVVGSVAPLRSLLAMGVGGGFLAALVVAAPTPAVAALAVLAVGALLSYGLHRYELVEMGLVPA